jgi:hypothetical protein
MIPQKERARAAATGASSRNASDLLVGWIAEEATHPTLSLQRLFWLRERYLSPKLAIQIAALAFSEVRQ